MLQPPDEVTAYLDSLAPDRREAMLQLRTAIGENLPTGFTETVAYGMISWCVPYSIYPQGYHCKPKQPLPFISIGSQKQHISLHHLALYEGSLLDWLLTQWPLHTTQKLDMGKGCVRFKRVAELPLALVGELARQMTPQQWVVRYEAAFRRVQGS